MDTVGEDARDNKNFFGSGLMNIEFREYASRVKFQNQRLRTVLPLPQVTLPNTGK